MTITRASHQGEYKAAVKNEDVDFKWKVVAKCMHYVYTFSFQKFIWKDRK